MRRIATALGAAAAMLALAMPGSAGASFGAASSFGGSGSGDGQLNHPQAVAVDSSGRVYVVDAGNGRVERFSAAGAFLNSYSISPNFDPRDVAIGPGGNIYIASPTRIDVWSSLGLHVKTWQPAGTAAGIAVDPSGNVYVSDAQNSQIHKYGGLGSDMGAFASQGSAPGQLLHPQGLTTDAAGSVYVADPLNSRVEEFSAAEEFAGEWKMPGYSVVAAGNAFSGTVFPHDVAVDSTGRVFAPDAGTHSNLVAVFDLSGDLQQLFGSPDSDPGNPCVLRAPWGLATSPSGSLYVASTGENRIRVFDEGSSSCPAPNFGSASGVGPGAAGGTAGAHSGLSKPKISFSGFPRGRCAHTNFAFLVHVEDAVPIKRFLLYVNGRLAVRQSPGKDEWNVKGRMPARTVGKEIPRGTSFRVLIEAKAVDVSGKRASAKRAFRICGTG